MTRQQLANGFQIRIPVENDTVLEAQERFQGRLQLTRQSVDLGVVSLDQSVGEVTITDDDSESTISYLYKSLVIHSVPFLYL